MFGRKNRSVIQYNYNTTNEIDYEKLAKAIIKAQKEAEEVKGKEQQQEDEKRRDEIIQTRLKKLDCADVFDSKGNPKTKTATIKLVWKFIICKEKVLKDISLLESTINGILSSIFLITEWILYLLSVYLIINGFVQLIYGYFTTKVFLASDFSELITSLLYALLLFVFSRLVIRTIKVECKYSKDNNYMLNFLAVIIAVIAIIVSIVVR